MGSFVVHARTEPEWQARQVCTARAAHMAVKDSRPRLKVDGALQSRAMSAWRLVWCGVVGCVFSER